MNSTYLPLLALLLGVACQTKPKTDDTRTQTDTVATVDLNRMPSESDPRSAADRMVRALYFEHDTKESPFLEANNPALAEQYFTKPTAALVQAKAATLGKQKRHALNPLFNVPDSRIAKRWVLPANVAGDKAVVFVTFNDGGKPQTMRCELEQIEKGRWRIADIIYADGTKLSDKR